MIRVRVEDILPPVALRVLRRLASEIRFAKYERKDVLGPNAELKGLGKGQRAFLLATGPSLKQEDLGLLEGEACYSVSNFFLHEKISVVKPKFHFFAPYHAPLVLENYLEWLQEADRCLPKETGIFLGHEGLPLVEKYNLFSNRPVHYLYLSEFVSSNMVDLLKPVLTPQSGPLMILPVLIYMEYSEIYLLGCDHTVLKDYGCRVKNFYKGHLDLRKNATDSASWGDIVSSHESSLSVFKQYNSYKSILERQEVLVKNLSRDSWLDTFSPETLENICR